MSLAISLIVVDILIYAIMIAGCGGGGAPQAFEAQATRPKPIQTPPPNLIGPVLGRYVVFGYNDLGMHCINQDFSELCVLPPANTLRAQVIDRSGTEPRIVTSGITVQYGIPGNTDSASKVNFWQYAPQIFGVNLPDNMGLFGFGLSGNMQVTADHDYMAQGIPITQVTDAGLTDYYQLANVTVVKNGVAVAGTTPVVPVSWEMSCNECHNTVGISVATDILRKHDNLHGTTLESQKPVLCARCHADPALGAAGQPGVSTLSSAMHTAHASRMGNRTNEQICYSCHPGPQTQCLRDVHKAHSMTCTDCHQSMAAVGDPNRHPWQDEPRCGSCHSVAGHEYEQPGVLYRNSVGHNGVKCITCHGSPHAIGPSLNQRDNVQPIRLQGHAGTINTCTVCHNRTPGDPFNHTRSD